MSNGLFDEDPNTKLTGLETLLGNVTMPQILQPSNKQLIDAAILKGSLELLKPRQQGENFASQASRALTAAGQPAKTLSDYLVSAAAGRTSGTMSDASAYDNVRKDVEMIIPDISSTLGIQDISPAQGMVRLYLNSVGRDAYDTGGMANIDQAITEHSSIILQYLQKDKDGFLIINPEFSELAPEGIIKLKDNINKAIKNEKSISGKSTKYDETIPQ